VRKGIIVPAKPKLEERIQKIGVGRLAFRVTDEFWHAYFAKMETMDGAILLGTIRMEFVANPEMKEHFMFMMSTIVQDIVEAMVGTRPLMSGPVEAPASEKQ
jgi:hypothetical protein